MSNDFTPGRRSRKGRPQLDAQTQAVADELSRRAARMWADSDGELSIAEAVELAAFRMGPELSQTATDREGGLPAGIPTQANRPRESP